MGALSSIESFIIWRWNMYKLLVVEDEVLIRDIIKEYFAARDYEGGAAAAESEVEYGLSLPRQR